MQTDQTELLFPFIFVASEFEPVRYRKQITWKCKHFLTITIIETRFVVDLKWTKIQEILKLNPNF